MRSLQFDEERIVDLVACIDRMEDLMEDLVSNSKLRPIADTGEGDISLWNKVSYDLSLPITLSGELAARPHCCSEHGKPSTNSFHVKQIARFFRTRDFKSAPWVVAESYHYRRLKECFSLSKHWKDYDVFFRQSEFSLPCVHSPSRSSPSLLHPSRRPLLFALPLVETPFVFCFS